MDLVLSLLVLAAFALVGGAWLGWRRGLPMKQVGLMLLLALVMIVNVAIWTVPDAGGDAPVDRLEDAQP